VDETQTLAMLGRDIFPCTGEILIKPLALPVLPEQASSCAAERGKARRGSIPVRAVPNNALEPTPTASARCAVQAAWKNVETPWVYRHPMSPWGEAS